MTPEQRRLRGRLGALAVQANGSVNVGPSHAAFLRRFMDQVDPDGTLPEPERMSRAIAARRLHMNRLALASSIARSKRPAPDRYSGAGLEARRDRDEPSAA